MEVFEVMADFLGHKHEKNRGKTSFEESMAQAKCDKCPRIHEFHDQYNKK